MDVKKFLTEYGLFLSFLVVFFIVIFFMCFLSKNFWSRGIEKQLESFLNKSYPEKYQVKENIIVNSPFSVSMAAYELNSINEKNQQEDSIAVVIKITTMYGPLPGVYEYKSSGEVDFLGIIGFDGKSKKENSILDGLKKSIQILRWKERIPDLLPLSYLDENIGGSI